jgi:preprotein translocase SecE subunit
VAWWGGVGTIVIVQGMGLNDLARFARDSRVQNLSPMELLPAGVRLPPGPPRPPAPPITGGSGGGENDFFHGRPSAVRIQRRRSPSGFLHEVVVETRKVAWPTQDDVLHNSAFLLGFLLLLAGAITAVDVGLANVVRVVTLGG